MVLAQYIATFQAGAQVHGPGGAVVVGGAGWVNIEPLNQLLRTCHAFVLAVAGRKWDLVGDVPCESKALVAALQRLPARWTSLRLIAAYLGRSPLGTAVALERLRRHGVVLRHGSAYKLPRIVYGFERSSAKVPDGVVRFATAWAAEHQG